MMKIIKSLSMIAIVAAVAVGATTAYFSDEEKSVGNTFTAGTIDIAIDGHNPFTDHFDIGDLKPGETGYINFDIQNVGENSVNVSKNLSNFAGTGGPDKYCNVANVNVSSEPEYVAEGGQFTGGDCNGTNWVAVDDVQTQILYDLSVKVYAQGNNTTPIWWQTIYTGAAGETLSSIYPDANHYVALGMIPVGGHMMVTQSYHFSKDADNKYQGDQLSFDITIRGDQLPQENGYASVVLENKTAGPEYAVIDDSYEGVLTYKTTNPTFDFSFVGKVTQPSTAYTLLYAVDPWPQIGSKVLGTVTSGVSGEVNFSGTANPGSITNGKVWLVLSSDWNGTQMSGWHQADYLLETGLINYLQN